MRLTGESKEKVIHQLATMSLIKELDDGGDAVGKVAEERFGEDIKSEKDVMIRLSERANVLCKHTAFIAVDEENDKPVVGPMIIRQIPMALLAEDFEDFEDEEEGSDFDDDDEMTLESFQTQSGKSRLLPEPSGQLRRQFAQSDVFSAIVSEQQASGAWPMSKTVANLVGKSIHDLKRLSPLKKVSPDVDEFVIWATAIVLVWLKVKCADAQDEWELMANKARKWLKKQKYAEEKNWESLLDDARKLI
eukprot:m.216420 g.216420  ORF g.216420 m.216420 type:complete len:248 (+) comp39869_c0_seq3:4460-5203(+)